MARGCDCDDNSGSHDYNGNVINENEKRDDHLVFLFFLNISSSWPDKHMSKVAVGLYAQNFLNQCIANGIRLSGKKTERERRPSSSVDFHVKETHEVDF